MTDPGSLSPFRANARALRGAFRFLTRLPVGGFGSAAAVDAEMGDSGNRDDASSDWEAFCSRPATFPIVGWVVGGLAAIPLLAAGTLPPSSVALGYLLTIYLLTGIHHLDGVADLGDAQVIHGDAERRREVLKDTTTGVGALLAVTLVVIALGLATFELAAAPVAVAVSIVVAAEVGAKVGMAAMACFATAAHDGLGSQLTGAATPSDFALPAVLAAPAIALSWPRPFAGVALVGALVGAALPWLWARRRLGGVTGDVFGAANEIGRVIGLHAGVIAWTLW